MYQLTGRQGLATRAAYDELDATEHDAGVFVVLDGV